MAARYHLCNCSSQSLKAADVPSTAIKYLFAVLFSFSSQSTKEHHYKTSLSVIIDCVLRPADKGPSPGEGVTPRHCPLFEQLPPQNLFVSAQFFLMSSCMSLSWKMDCETQTFPKQPVKGQLSKPWSSFTSGNQAWESQEAPAISQG